MKCATHGDEKGQGTVPLGVGMKKDDLHLGVGMKCGRSMGMIKDWG